MEGVKNNHYDAIKSLIEIGKPNLNVRNRMGNTSLHIAVLNGYKEMLELLVDKGADVLLKNDEDYTCLDSAFNMGY